MMASEIWYRNPSNYIRELREVGKTNIIFDYGWIVKRHINPVQWASLYLGDTQPYRMLVCGDQGTAEYEQGNTLPVAVYPTWQYGDDESLLETYLAKPIGNDINLCNLEDVPVAENAVFGQEHRVVIMNFPNLNTGPGKQFIKFARELQLEYPDAILHVHGLTTFSVPSRLEFAAFDWDPRTPAGLGNIVMPTGHIVYSDDRKRPYEEWIKLMGMRSAELDEPRMRCIFNIRSSSWAAENFTKDSRIVVDGSRIIDMTSPDNQYALLQNNRIMFKNRVRAKPSDKFICNSCSLATNCKYYREGSVCTVPGSESKELAEYFKTRDTATIMDGLSAIMQINADRLVRGVEAEEDGSPKKEFLDKNVTQIAGQLFDQGVKLAKLIDPSLRNPKVQFNVGGATTNNISLSDPRQFIAAAVKSFIDQGFTLEQITPTMMEHALRGAGAHALGDPEEAPPIHRIIEASPVVMTQAIDLEELPF